MSGTSKPTRSRLWRRGYVRLTKKTTLYWWPNPRHRHYQPGTGKPAFFSMRRRADLGGGLRCSWIELGIFELRTVHKP